MSPGQRTYIPRGWLPILPTTRRLPNFTVHYNHLRGLGDFWRLGPTPRPTESECLQKLGIGYFKMITGDSNVKLSLESRVQISALIPSQGRVSDRG